MITFLFYIVSILFACNEVYYVLNKLRLDTNFKNLDLTSSSKVDIAHYLFRIMFWVWMIIGIWSSQSGLFIFLCILHAVRFPFYHLSRRLYIIWTNILPSISFIFILIILVYKIKG
jgi:hypothetical protein